MKKFLSLVLALVMTMSLVTVSAGAKDFTDSTKIQYAEAVDVMSAVKVIDGYAEGDFRPTATLTRGAAAKIICNLILGPTTAGALVADAAPYKDVPANHTFAGYIAYCQKEGIISGYADGTFKPANSLTGYAFMKMLLGALGYKADVEGYTSPNWSINVAKQALNAKLNDGLKGDFNGVKAVNREEACLYAFNTLKATMVEYDTTITIGGVTVAGARKDVVNSAKTETVKDDNKMQFAERYFSKLTAKEDTDAFERPATTWSNGKETIGTYVDYTQMVAEYTTKVSGKELYDVVGKTAFDDYKFSSYVDGADSNLYKEVSKDNKANVSNTGNGALTQVFVNNDDNHEKVVITVVNTYLAQATSDYNSKKNTVTYEIFDKTTKNNQLVKANFKGTVSGDDFAIEKVESDDFALVTYSYKEDAIQSIDEVNTIADTEITSFKSGKSGNLTVAGTKYDYNKKAAYDLDVLKAYTEVGGDTNLKDVTYNVYVDQYGYVVGVEEVSAPDNYVFITGADSSSSNLTTKNWTANAIFMDGTSKVIDVKNNGAVSDSAVINKWYTYTVSNSGVYTLTKVNDNQAIIGKDNAPSKAQNQTMEWENGGTAQIDKKHITLTGIGSDSRIYGNDATVYLLADLDAVDSNVVITDVDEIVTGVKNASFTVYGWDKAAEAAEVSAADRTSTNTSWGTYALYKDNGYVIAAVVVGESDTVSSDLAYVLDSDVTSESYNKTTGEWTWTRDLIIGGEKVEVKETNDTGVSVLKNLPLHTWVTVKYDAKGNVKKVETNVKHMVNSVAGAVTEIEKDEDLVILKTTSTTAYSLKGNTLYDKTNAKLGFLIADDVKIVLKQQVKNKDVTSYEDGVKTLSNILDNLNEDAKDYSFAAVIEKGVATIVVIEDSGKDNNYNKPDGNGSTAKVEVTVSVVEKKVNVASSDANITWTAIAEHALDKLTDMGYAFKDWDGNNKTLTVTNANGESVAFTVTCSLLK